MPGDRAERNNEDVDSPSILGYRTPLRPPRSSKSAMLRVAGRRALLAGLLAAFVAGCGGGDDRSDVDPSDVRLAAVIKGLDNPYFVTMRDGLVATARRNDTPLEVAAAPTGLQDTAGQASALESLDAITDDRELSDEVVKLLRARHEIRLNQLPDSLDPEVDDVSAAGIGLTRELIATERKFIHRLLRDGKITDETRRHIERDLDLEEASLANREFRKIPL